MVYYQAVLTREPPNSTNHLLRALCHLGLGSTYELNGQLKLAFESYSKALNMFEQAHDGYLDELMDDSYLTYIHKAHCFLGLGNLCLIERKSKRADVWYRKALSLFDKHLPIGHPDLSRTRQKIANIIQIYGRKPAVALDDYEDCLENYLRALPSDHVDVARVYADMTRSYEQLPSELQKALEYTKKAADIFEKTLPKEHTDNLTICMVNNRIKNKLRSQN